MAERRYSEDEVTRIFQHAAEAQQTARRHLPPGEGLTLAELRAIGLEVGLPAELVNRAARALDHPEPSADRRFLGLPVGVGHTVELARRLSDAEWDQLVVDLRQTFDARGTVRADGSLRQWTNGNLQVLLEPTPPEGHRIRMRTVKADARALMTTGVSAVAGAGIVLAGMTVLGVQDAEAVLALGLAALGGVGAFMAGAVRVPGWARRRREQMQGVATRLALAAEPDEHREP